MSTMHCPYCDKDVEVVSRKAGLRKHIATAHPGEVAAMDLAQYNKKRIGTPWRCLKCDQVFRDPDIYEAHYASTHA